MIMANDTALTYVFVQDEPWMFLDARKNPVNGRKVTYQLEDGTFIELDLTMLEYNNPASVKAKLDKSIKAHAALTGV